MSLQAFWESVEASPLGDFIASSAWAFPTIESIHVVAIVTVVGTVAIMDLRLLGWASPAWTARQVSNDTLRWTWLAFAVAAVTGVLMFISKAHVYAREPWFLAKLALIAVAGVNMAIFEATTWKRVVGWDTDRKPPGAAIFAAGLSLTLWIVVVFFGRMIGFTLGQYQ